MAKRVVFISPHGRYGVGYSGDICRFDGGQFPSEDPELIEALKKSEAFNRDFFIMGEPPAAMAAEMALKDPSAIRCPMPGCAYVVPAGDEPASSLIRHMAAAHSPKEDAPVKKVEKAEKAEK